MGECGEKIIFVRVEGRISGGAGGDDTSDFASHQFCAHLFLGELGIFHLFADGDFETFADEFADVAFGGVVRHSAHGDGNAFFFVAGSQRDLQLFRGYDRIVEKKFVEVSQTKEQKGCGMFFFDGGVLAHQRSGRLGHCLNRGMGWRGL